MEKIDGYYGQNNLQDVNPTTPMSTISLLVYLENTSTCTIVYIRLQVQVLYLKPVYIPQILEILNYNLLIRISFHYFKRNLIKLTSC